MAITLYCDGGCRGQKRDVSIGGYGVVVMKRYNEIQQFYGTKENTTNNRMELFACIQGLRYLFILKPLDLTNEKITVVTDSKYVIQGINDLIEFWEDNAWMTARGNPVKNKDLWLELRDLQNRIKDISFTHVKRNTNAGNVKADQLASKAMDIWDRRNFQSRK